MKKNIWKRLLSLALALVLVAGMVPHMATEAHAASKTDSASGIKVEVYNVYCTHCNQHKTCQKVRIERVSLSGKNITIVVEATTIDHGSYTVNEIPDTITITYPNFDCNTMYEATMSTSSSGWRAASSNGGVYTSGIKVSRSAGHSVSSWSSNGDGTHSGTCSLCGSVTENCNLSTATCTTPATCSTCGYEQGGVDADNHDFGSWIQHKSSWHMRTCVRPGCGVSESADCSGGYATCKVPAYCVTCQGAYGTTLPHSYTYAMKEGTTNVLVESCPNGCGHSVEATLTASDAVYSGFANETATITYGDGWKGTNKTTDIAYENNTLAGTATAKIIVEDKELSTTFTISKAAYDFTPPAAKDLTYTGEAQALVEAGKADSVYGESEGKVLYSLDGQTYSENIPTGINAGSYTVYYKVEGLDTENYNEISAGTVPVTIAKAAAPAITFPEVLNDITYGQSLEEAKLSFYENKYGTFNWNAPTAYPSKAGTSSPALDFYPNELALQNYAWTDAGDAQWIASRNALCICPNVTVNKAPSTATAPTAKSGLVYDGTSQTLIAAGSTNDGTMVYSLEEDGTYTDELPTATAAGTYHVWYKVIGDGNHNDSDPADLEAKIAKADPGIGAVTADVVNDTLETSAIVLTRANEDVQGDLIVDAGQTLAWGENTIRYTFTPNDTANYTIVTGDVAVTVKDTIAPTGTVTISTRSWAEFLNSITFGLFFKETQTVSVIADDNLSEVAKVEYYASAESLTLENVQTITNWTEYNGEFSVTLEDAKRFVYYVRITDNADNVTYISSDGAEYDITAPVIDGVDNGATYYTTQKVTVSDKNIATVTLNGEEVSESITLEGSKDATYTIVATDKAGNSTTVTVTMKPISTLAAPIDALTEDNVNSGDEQAVDGIKAAVAAVDTIKATEEEKAALKEITDKAEALKKVIDETKAEIARINEELSKYDAATVNSDDPPVLEQLAKDIKKLLDGDNLTDAERTAFTEAAEDVADMQKTVADTTAENQRISDAADGYDITTVTSGDKADLEKLLADIDKQLESTNLTDEEISGLNGDKKAVEDLLAKIAGVDELIDKLIEDVNEYSDDTVKSTDQEAIEQMIDDIEVVLETDNLTEDEEKALEDARDKAEGMLETIEEAAKATDTDNTEKVEDVTADNVTPDDKSDLEKAKADLEDALENNGGNYTDDEKKAIEDEVKRIEDALEVIGNVEAVEELIGKIPATVTKNAEAAIKAADKAYNALSDYEKSLVDKDAKKALEKAEAALAELQKEETPDTGDDTNLYLWFILVLASGMCLFGIALNELKRKAAARR